MWFLLLVLFYSTTALKVQRIDGVSSSYHNVSIESNASVSSLRQKLIEEKIIQTNQTHDWRIAQAESTLQLINEKYVPVSNFCEPIKFINILNKDKILKINIGNDKSEKIVMDGTMKLETVRQYLNGKGWLGSTDERCVAWRFRTKGTDFVKDESALTVDQHLTNSGMDHLELFDYYKQGKVVELFVYKGLDKKSLPKVPLRMNVRDMRMVLNGTFTCHGERYNYLDDNWVLLKKTANLAKTKAPPPNLQISPDLIFSQGEEQTSIVENAHFVSRNGRNGIEYVSKTRKGNLIGEVVSNYTKGVSPKVSMNITKSGACYNDCNKGITLNPVMLNQVHSTNVEAWPSSRVVICEKGTAIAFGIDIQPREPFWVKVKHATSDELWVDTRGDWGTAYYFARGYNNIVVDSHVIEKEEDLLDKNFAPLYSVEVYKLIKTDDRRITRQAPGETMTVPEIGRDNGQLKRSGSAFTGSGTDAGYGPGVLITDFQFVLLTFKSKEIAQEIIGRNVQKSND